ncbi:DUF3105 domain-containing protein [Phycicoccus sp. MAQZ13P-2]|uniref:DUF3105 domain-containing protein n=1 Tax=Phycicoccus mangrovi TaxID=2840470 RepID=UPI001BFFFDEE|nr:DUF3105 domain-containing protein [Phycicoccus mangrovi]MBT9254609.1 DUF3105 domain-containing protein [Phycicoccus mangrovi]MBT9273186.1 DUF3105 domain-containing protein [Phycicoccus mangrovi]
MARPDRPSRARLEELKNQQRARERRTRWLWVVGTSLAVLAIVGAVVLTVARDVASRPSLDAVTTYEPSSTHVTAPVAYDQAPPVGGDHNPVWLNCGVYDAPVPNENAVHSLEHGAVWVTYSPDLPARQVHSLFSNLPADYVVVSPHEDLPAPVVASAWGAQLVLDGVDDPRVAEFVREYRQGPQSPEPGAACSGGTDGEPA